MAHHTTDEDSASAKIGESAFASIAEMVAALQCDYERLEELRELRTELPDGDFEDQYPAEFDELADLEESSGDCESEEDARQRIEEDPLSLQLRSGWFSPGETPVAEEYELLLTTGGPAVRIIGQLNQYFEPASAQLQVQDWGTPWTDHPCDEEVLLAYASCFYFGE